MSRTVYVNGDFLPEENAKISVFDRGFLFADGVYEVTTVIGGKLLDFDGHMARLKRSLGELDMNQPAEIDTLLEIHKRLIEENSLVNGLIYLQVTRGAADRDFAFPPEDTPMSVVLFTQTSDPTKSKLSETGARVIVVPDNRWARRDIKTVQLLYPSLAKMAAKKAGADDAWMEEATYNNTYEFVQWALESGEDVLAQSVNEYKAYPLHYAAFYGDPRTIEFLVKNGADIIRVHDVVENYRMLSVVSRIIQRKNIKEKMVTNEI